MGILNPLYDLVAWLIMRIHAVLAVPLGPQSGATWVLTIVVLVVLMRLALLPLFVKQMHSQRKMLALAPELQALRKRYKNDKQKLQEEMMKLYKEHGANPLSGCLPLVAQLPLWFALLNVLRAISEHKVLYGMSAQVVAEANNARIFGVSIADRFLFQHPAPALHVKVVIAITVLISAVTTFLSVRQSMKRGLMQNPVAAEDNPMAGAQKYMVYIAPVFALSGLYWQFGLVVYWLTSNIWQVGQQYFLFKKIPPLTPTPAAAGAGAGKAPASVTQATTVRQKPVTGQSAKRAVTARPAGSAKPAGTAKPSATAAGTAQSSGTAKPAGAGQPAATAAKSSAGAATRPAAQPPGTAPSVTAKQGGSPRKRAAAKSEAESLGIPPPTSNGGGGMLRKLVKGRAEPAPEPEPPEVTFVRQQRAKQSRSKRSGKR